MITWRGAGYCFLIVIISAALAYSGLLFLEILLLSLIFLPISSAAFLLLSRRLLWIWQDLEFSTVEREGLTNLQIQMQQKGFWSNGQIDFVIRMPGNHSQPVFARKQLVLMAGSISHASFPMTCTHRGIYPVGLWRIRSRDLFGLFYLPVRTHRQCQRQQILLTALPVPQKITDLDHVFVFLSEQNHQAQHIGDEIDAVANLRAQRPGDSLKRAHWKLSARLNKIMIKEFESPFRRECLVILDLARPEYLANNQPGLLDLADFFTDRAAYLIQQVLETGNQLRVVSYQADGRAAYSADRPSDFYQMQLMLAKIDWTDHFAVDLVIAEETPVQRQASVLVLMTTRLDLASAQYLIELKNRGFQVYLLLVDEQQTENSLQQEALQGLDLAQIACLVINRHAYKDDAR